MTTDGELSPYDQEVSAWATVKQKVDIGGDEQLFREVSVPDGFTLPKVSRSAKEFHRNGWWDPQVQKWVLFDTQPHSVRFAGDVFLSDLPTTFSGGRFLFAYGDGKEFSASLLCDSGKTLAIVPALPGIPDDVLERMPVGLPPEMGIKHQGKLQFMGVVYIAGSRSFYAVFGQGRDAKLMCPVQSAQDAVDRLSRSRARIPAKAIRSRSIRQGFAHSWNVTVGQLRVARVEKTKMDLFNQQQGRRLLTKSTAGDRVISVWTPSEGWNFIIQAEYPSKELSTVRPKGGIDPNFITSQVLHDSTGLFVYFKEGFLNIPELEAGSKSISFKFPLKAEYSLQEGDAEKQNSDEVLAVMSAGMDGRFTCLWGREGRPLGWEPFYGFLEFEKGGYLQERTGRYHFDIDQGLESTFRAIREIGAKQLNL